MEILDGDIHRVYEIILLLSSYKFYTKKDDMENDNRNLRVHVWKVM